jgi:starch phosphorylase
MQYSKTQIKESIQSRLDYHFGVKPENASEEQIYKAVAMTVTDLLSAKRRNYTERVKKASGKTVYYMSMEFLLGRSLKNNLFNLELTKNYEDALNDFGIRLETLYEMEPDAGLGNGGLGRLAACYLDSAASLGYPVTGYSIQYEFGIFRQKIVEGWQTELPDFWLPGGEVWLTPRIDEAVTVQFDGELTESWNDGYHSVQYQGCNSVTAVPYDMFISGYNGRGASLLRLWSAKNPSIDINLFNQGDYMRAIEQSAMAEVISKVLYPSDNHPEGKSLRLRQQYFLVSASVQDIIKKHLSQYDSIANLPEKAVIHINETHAALAIPELMRILLDDCGFEWDKAWDIVTRTAAFTNHTVMSEALEVWPEGIFKSRLPRIYQIVKEINDRLVNRLYEIYPGDTGKVSYMAIIASGQIRMANLCVASCFSVNGVSAIHSRIVKEELFADYGRTFPQKFTNVTNGIAHRRWLCQSNPELTSLLRDLIGPGFIEDASQLEKLRKYAGDKNVLSKLAEIKYHNKLRLADYIEKTTDIRVDPSSLFDMQVKRLHEYKRQTLNILHVLHLYEMLRENPNLDMQPQTFIFGAKAAPGYYMAKQIIRLICSVAKEIEADKVIREKLRVVFLEDYRVTLAELLMPAAEISEQISLAGTEASGTGNMKLMINGAVTLGTLDGANIEMRDAVGDDNILIFGMHADEVETLYKTGYSPTRIYQGNQTLKDIIGRLNTGIGGISFNDVASSLVGVGNTMADRYMVLADFDAYCRAHEEALRRYADMACWNGMSLQNIAGAGYFSADRAVKEYADHIWHITKI